MRLYEQLAAQVTSIVVRPTERPVAWHERLPTRRARAGRVRAGGGAAAQVATDLRRLPPAAGILRAAGALPVLHLGRPRPRRHPLPRHRAGNHYPARPQRARPRRPRPEHLQLNCTPAINLFPKRSDRVNLDASRAEHHVVPGPYAPARLRDLCRDRHGGLPRGRRTDAAVLPLLRRDRPQPEPGPPAATTCSAASRIG